MNDVTKRWKGTGVNLTNPLALSANAPVRGVSVTPTKLRLTLPVHKTRNYAQLLHLTLYAMHQKDQSKSTGTKAAHKMMMKLKPQSNIR